MPATSNSIAFEIPIESKGKPVPKGLEQRKLAERRSLSREDLTAKLDSAASRKKAKEEDRVAKAKQLVERAKGTANKAKEIEAASRMESMHKLNEKLQTASKIKDESVGKRRKNASEHLEMVDSRKEAYTQDVLTPGDQDLKAKLTQAEERRKTLEGSRREKLNQHHKTVEMRKSQEDLPLRASPSAERLASKMAAAEIRRRALEESQMQKFAARDEHAKQVRKRKATTSMELSAQ